MKNQNIMKNIRLIALLALAIAGCGGSKKDSTGQADSANMTRDSGSKVRIVPSFLEISKDDASFAVKAAAGGMEEVELGKLAQEKGSSQAVKDFGAMMVKDHSAANVELAQIAKDKKITLPQQLGDDALKLEAELRAKDGKEFDKAYAEAMVKDHKEDIDEFVRGIKVVKETDLLAFVKKTLPVLKMHLAAAQRIKSTY
jgi:putative membrane protein